MDVSVVIPTRNRSALLSRTLRSALRQEHVDVEVIVVDEASNDDTPALLSALDDHRVRVLRHESPRGLSAARNHGAEHADAEWLAFLDDDDLWAPDKLFRQLNAARAAGRDWAYTGSVNIENGRIVRSAPAPSEEEVVAALPRFPILPGGGSNVIVRRETFTQVGPFDTRLDCGGEDWELWIRLAKHGWPAGVREPLMAKRIHSSNMFAETDRIVRATTVIQTLHDTPIDWGRMYQWLAERYLRQGRWLTALSMSTKAAAHGHVAGVAAVLLPFVRHRLRRTLGLQQEPPRVLSDRRAAQARAWLQEFEPILDDSTAA
jgi:cellulose synthase/poly-beta-1,6-N-acetylglucosamine synthase-like glycosyltransferase